MCSLSRGCGFWWIKVGIRGLVDPLSAHRLTEHIQSRLIVLGDDVGMVSFSAPGVVGSPVDE